MSDAGHDVNELVKRAASELLAPLPEGAPVLGLDEIMQCLPHRAPFLFLDKVWRNDGAEGVIVAGFSLSRASDVFDGHFPGAPMFPGVLQVEAVAQAGLVLATHPRSIGQTAAMTHVLGARFVRPVDRQGELIIMARVLDDGLFLTVVGQCVQRGEITSAAAVQALAE